MHGDHVHGDAAPRRLVQDAGTPPAASPRRRTSTTETFQCTRARATKTRTSTASCSCSHGCHVQLPLAAGRGADAGPCARCGLLAAAGRHGRGLRRSPGPASQRTKRPPLSVLKYRESCYTSREIWGRAVPGQYSVILSTAQGRPVHGPPARAGRVDFVFALPGLLSRRCLCARAAPWHSKRLFSSSTRSACLLPRQLPTCMPALVPASAAAVARRHSGLAVASPARSQSTAPEAGRTYNALLNSRLRVCIAAA